MKQQILRLIIILVVAVQLKATAAAQTPENQVINDLRIAVQADETEKVKEILNSVSAERRKHLVGVADGKYGATLLHWAAYQKNAELVAYFIELGADVNSRNKSGDLPLHQAVIKFPGKKDNEVFKVVELLASKMPANFNYNALNNEGITPLHLASAAGYLEVIKFLMEKKAEPNVKNSREQNAFDYAQTITEPKLRQEVIAILKNNINTTLVQPSSSNPAPLPPQAPQNKSLTDFNRLKELVEQGNAAAVIVFLEGSRWWNKEADAAGNTLLHLAAEACQPELVAELIKSGADVTRRNKTGKTFLQVACRNR